MQSKTSVIGVIGGDLEKLGMRVERYPAVRIVEGARFQPYRGQSAFDVCSLLLQFMNDHSCP
jgi:hypothetical protein